MSKIDELLKELCPDGVEWKELVDVVKTISPPIKLKVDSYLRSGLFPIIDQSKDQIAGYTDDISNTLPDGQYILYGDHTLAVKYYDGRFAQGADGLKILLSKGSLPKYIYYCICAYNIQSNEYKRHWTQAKQIKLPIPPLPIQQHIVEVLDTFTDAISNLEEELALREKQFEYYREHLYQFDDECSIKTIKDISVKCFPGATPSTKKPEYWQNGTIPWMSSGETHQGQVKTIAGRITQLGYDSSSTKMVPINSIVVALAGQGKTRGTVAITRMELCTNQSLCAIIPDQSMVVPEYLYFYLKGQYFNLRQVSAGDGTRGGLTLKHIESYKVPVISLARQHKIVEILDTFEAMIANIKEEIALRTKQYEYYREKLLSFGK